MKKSVEGKTRKFKVRTKQSSLRAKHRRRKDAKSRGAEPAARKTLCDRVLEFANASEAPQLRQKYEAIFGISRPIDDVLAANQFLLKKMVPLASSALDAHVIAHPYPVFRQVTRVEITPGSNAEVSVIAARKAAKIYERAGVDVIAAVRLRPVPHETDANDFALSVELEALFFGENAEAKVAAKARTSRPPPGVIRSSAQRIDSGDTTALSAAIDRLLKPNFTGLPLEDLFNDPPPPPNWSGSTQRGLRAYVMLMALAQLPLKKMLVLHGAGGPIFAQAIAEAKRALKAACKAAPPVVDRDGVPHFFFPELRRIGLDDVSVPLVKLR